MDVYYYFACSTPLRRSPKPFDDLRSLRYPSIRPSMPSTFFEAHSELRTLYRTVDPPHICLNNHPAHVPHFNRPIGTHIDIKYYGQTFRSSSFEHRTELPYTKLLSIYSCSSVPLRSIGPAPPLLPLRPLPNHIATLRIFLIPFWLFFVSLYLCHCS